MDNQLMNDCGCTNGGTVIPVALELDCGHKLCTECVVEQLATPCTICVPEAYNLPYCIVCKEYLNPSDYSPAIHICQNEWTCSICTKQLLTKILKQEGFIE